MGGTLMSPRPCGIYIYVADLCETVYYTSDADAPREMIDEILILINQQWGKESVVDVMLMAECFWTWKYEMIKGYKKKKLKRLKTLQFEAIMMRIKNDKLLPTVVTTSSLEGRETLGLEAVGLDVNKDDESNPTIIHRNITETKH